MVDDLGARLCLEATFPSGDEGGVGDNFAGGVDGADVCEDFVGYVVGGVVRHVCITAYFAVKCKKIVWLAQI